MPAVFAAEDVLRFNIAVGDAMFMTVLDGRKYLQERIADLVFLRAVVVGCDSGKEITTTVEVEDEEISGEATVDAVMTEVDVRVEGDCVCDVFVPLDVLLRVELLGRTVGRLVDPGDHLDRNLPVGLGVFSNVDGP